MVDATRICTVCEKREYPRRYKRGMCGACYQRWRRYGHVTSPPLVGMDRFWSRVEKTETCWNWTGSVTSGGYGAYGNRTVVDERQAHRIAYVDKYGPIPEGLVLDHLCRNRLCVNPHHLEAVTTRVNILRGEAPTAHNARREVCADGHPIDTVRADGHRECSTCRAKWVQRRLVKRAAAKQAQGKRPQ